jgi:GNAT superfamily N-acetyltransferase
MVLVLVKQVSKSSYHLDDPGGHVLWGPRLFGHRRPNWQLLEFGVEPSLQGKGIGCALLQPFLIDVTKTTSPLMLLHTRRGHRFTNTEVLRLESA